MPYRYLIGDSWFDSRPAAYYRTRDVYFETAYGFGVYNTAWERMPANTHISAIFAMGDRCTKDIGEAGPDAATGLGYLDVGCMAKEVYQVNLNPSAATLSVAFVRATVSSGQSQSSEGGESSQAQSSSVNVEGQTENPDRQKFFDDFAQELFFRSGQPAPAGQHRCSATDGLFPATVSAVATVQPTMSSRITSLICPSPVMLWSAAGSG